MSEVGVSDSESTHRHQLLRQSLLRYGIPCHLDGWQYLLTALAKILEQPDLLDSMTKELYPAIAADHQATDKQVERSMLYALYQAWNRGDRFRKLFGPARPNKRRCPTISEFLATLADQLASLPLLGR